MTIYALHLNVFRNALHLHNFLQSFARNRNIQFNPTKVNKKDNKKHQGTFFQKKKSHKENRRECVHSAGLPRVERHGRRRIRSHTQVPVAASDRGDMQISQRLCRFLERKGT